MKKHNLYFLIIYSMILFIMPRLLFADCEKKVHEQRPKMEWYLNDCGEWRQAYPGEDPYGDRPTK